MFLEIIMMNFLSALLEHIEISFIAIVTAIVLAILLQYFLTFIKNLVMLLFIFFSLMYAIPSFALFALLIPITGLGQTTAIIVLVIYAQYILVRTFCQDYHKLINMLLKQQRLWG